MTEPILQVRGISKSFSGLAAVDRVSLDVEVGSLHAVIGPNGAGKTTLINLLSGDLTASLGTILFRGVDVSRRTPNQRSRLGIARSYQRTNIFPTFTALENCRLAAQSREPRPLHWWHDARADRALVGQAQCALESVGLGERGADLALALSHGEQRQLEIALCLATRPKLLLLDEPLAGMGAEESIQMVRLIERIAASHAVLLIEHDMDAVFQLAKALTVMVDGKVLASGTPEEIRGNRAVQVAYLGAGEGSR